MITIRKARLKDIPAMIGLWKEMMEHQDSVMKKHKDIRHLILKMKKDAPDFFRKFLNKNIRSRNSIVHVAEVDDEVVGYCITSINKNNIFETRRTGFISDIFVKEDLRGKGMSSRLKDESFKWLKKNGIEYVSLTTFKGNKTARSIYNKWGFKEINLLLSKKI